MKILFYSSKLCPRCYMVRRSLKEICNSDEQFEFEEIDILQQPKRTWQAGIRMIPALQADKAILSGTYLTKPQILKFIQELGNRT